MKCYRINNDCDIVEMGDFAIGEAIELLRLHNKKESEGVSSLGLCRSDKDFVEISYCGLELFLIHTDKLCKTSGFIASLFSRGFIEARVTGIQKAEEVVQAYYTKDRKAFEQFLSGLA